jgi:hypothetical protein
MLLSFKIDNYPRSSYQVCQPQAAFFLSKYFVTYFRLVAPIYLVAGKILDWKYFYIHQISYLDHCATKKTSYLDETGKNQCSIVQWW